VEGAAVGVAHQPAGGGGFALLFQNLSMFASSLLSLRHGCVHVDKLAVIGSAAQIDEGSDIWHGLPACGYARHGPGIGRWCAFWLLGGGVAHPVSFFLSKKKRESYAVTRARNRETRSLPSELHGYAVTPPCAPTCVCAGTHAPACTHTRTCIGGARNRVTA
jgi:hypothetical protein